MTPCSHVFGTLDDGIFPLDVMVHAMRAGDYEPVVDEDGEWKPMEGRAILRHVTSTMPRIRFSSLVGTRPAPSDAIAAALACLAPDGIAARTADLDVETQVDALMRIAIATGSTKAEPGRVRLMHAPTPWSPIRTEILGQNGDREEAPSDGDGIEHLPVCVHVVWQSRIEPPRFEPVPGLEIEPFQVIVHPQWRADPMETIRVLRSAAAGFRQETHA